MTTDQTNIVTMFRTATDFCDDNATATASITAFAPLVTQVKNKILFIDQFDQIASGSTKGVTLDANAIRKTLEQIAFKVASAVSSYASANNLNELKASVDFTASDFKRFKKDVLDDKAQTVHDAANALPAAIFGYGISATDISDLATAILLWRAAMPSSRQAKINIKDANRQIKQQIKQTTTLLDDQLDPLASTLKLSNAEFHNKYFDSREIIDLGKGTTTLEVSAVETDGSRVGGGITPIFKAQVKVNELNLTQLTDLNGITQFKKIKIGIYTITVSADGFITQTSPPFRIKLGQTVTKQFILVRA